MDIDIRVSLESSPPLPGDLIEFLTSRRSYRIPRKLCKSTILRKFKKWCHTHICQIYYSSAWRIGVCNRKTQQKVNVSLYPIHGIKCGATFTWLTSTQHTRGRWHRFYSKTNWVKVHVHWELKYTYIPVRADAKDLWDMHQRPHSKSIENFSQPNSFFDLRIWMELI